MEVVDKRKCQKGGGGPFIGRGSALRAGQAVEEPGRCDSPGHLALA